MNKKLATSSQLVPQFQVVTTIKDALQLNTPVGSVILLDKYPVNFQIGNWNLSQGTKIVDYHAHLHEKQGIVFLVGEHKITAYARFSGEIHSLSRKLPWFTFINEFIKF